LTGNQQQQQQLGTAQQGQQGLVLTLLLVQPATPFSEHVTGQKQAQQITYHRP